LLTIRELLVFITAIPYICQTMEKDSNILLIVIIVLLCIVAIPLIIGLGAFVLPIIILFIILFILRVRD